MYNADDQMGMHVVLEGSLGDGFQVIGPFKTGDEAVEWADHNFSGTGTHWEVMPLQAPQTSEG